MNFEKELDKTILWSTMQSAINTGSLLTASNPTEFQQKLIKSNYL